MNPSLFLLLAEGRNLDELVVTVQWFFVATALPGVGGMFLARYGGGVRVVAFSLSLVSVVAGVCWLGWVCADGGSVLPSFYVAAGTPLLVGLAACVWVGRSFKKPGPRV